MKFKFTDFELPNDQGNTPVCYLIHFEDRLHHAGHYLGYTTNLEKRIERHRNSQSAKLLIAINKLGIKWDVVRTWINGSPQLERKLKNRHNGPQLCPICALRNSNKKEN
jgi:predicted GIY-YIG superfamily endonuclease